MLSIFFKKKVVRARKINSSSKHYQQHKENARKIIFERLEYYAPLCGVTYGRVAIRNQRRRWGSCSSLGNLNFNYRLVFLPTALVDYIVVHELCHLKELNHGPDFWFQVEIVLPDYQQRIKELRIEEMSVLRLNTNQVVL